MRRENCFADDHGKLLGLGSIIARDDECSPARCVFYGNGKQSEIVAGGLREEFDLAAVENGGSEFSRTGDAQGVTELYRFRSGPTLLRNKRMREHNANEESGRYG